MTVIKGNMGGGPPTIDNLDLTVQAFACERCSHINEQFLDADITGA